MDSILLQALTLLAACGYARSLPATATCAIEKGKCDTDKYVTCGGETSAVIVKSLNDDAFRKTNLPTCSTSNKPLDSRSLDATDHDRNQGTCFHTCTPTTGGKQQVFCVKVDGSWFPFQRKVPIPVNTASAMTTAEFLDERLKAKFDSLSECSK